MADILRMVNLCEECKRRLDLPFRGSTYCEKCLAKRQPDFIDDHYNDNQPPACDYCTDLIMNYKKGFCAVHHQKLEDLKEVAEAACSLLDLRKRHELDEGLPEHTCGGCTLKIEKRSKL